jgi:integrase
VFLTPGGQRWVWTRGRPSGAATDLEELAHISRADRVTDAMGQLLGKLGLVRRSHTFYSLRHTFETIGDESRDQVAVDAIMGHSRDDSDRSAKYILSAVVPWKHGVSKVSMAEVLRWRRKANGIRSASGFGGRHCEGSRLAA